MQLMALKYPPQKNEAVHQGCCCLLQEATVTVQATCKQSCMIPGLNVLKRLWHSHALQVLFALGKIHTPHTFLSNGVRKDKYSDKMDRYFVDFKGQSSHKQSETEIETHTSRGQA